MAEARSRRSFLVTLGAGAASVVAGGCSRGCSTHRRPGGSASNAAQVAKVLPAYHPLQLLEPEIQGEGPIPDGFLSYPKTEFVKVIKKKPGRGGPRIHSMMPTWGPAPPGLGRNAYVDAVNAQLGVVVNPTVQDGMTFADKLSALLAARDVPDLLSVPSWEIDKIPRYSQAVKALFADLTEHLQGERVKNYPMLATLPTTAWQYSVWDGRLSAVPYPQGVPFPWAMFYRKDIFDRLGLAPPNSIDALYRLLKRLTNPKQSVWACSDIFDMVQMYFRCPHSQGGWRKKPGGGLEFKYETEEYRAALEFTARVFQEGLVHPDLLASKGADAKQLFKSGRIVLMQDGLGTWAPMQSEQQKVNPQFEMQALPVFASDGGEPLTWADNKPIFYTFIKQGLAADREKELLSVLNWCAAPFGSKEYELNRYGVEGKHFTRAPDNSPLPTELGRKEIATQFDVLGGRAPVMVGSSELPGHVRDELAYSKRTAKYLEKDLFEGIKLELPPGYSKIITTTEDKLRDLVRGRRPLSDLDQIVEEWRRSGGDQGREFLEKVLADNGR